MRIPLSLRRKPPRRSVSQESMSVLGVWLVFLAMTISSLSCSQVMATVDAGEQFNVMDYGATSDGQTDDSQAFLKAWTAACSSSGSHPRILVPQEKTFLLNPVVFQGPCNGSRIDFEISGTIRAPESPSSWAGIDASQWIVFRNIEGLQVHGSGTVDGMGKSWWDQSCRYHPQLANCTKLAPTALKFISCKWSSVSSLKFVNSSQTHILLSSCHSFVVKHISIDSPGDTPNTDGIHIQFSHDVIIINSKIGCGDDCISIGDHISDIVIANVQCGPGHGISIGSLGKSGNYVQVERIRVTDALFNGTTNGARIKTWEVGQGFVRDVVFENLMFVSVTNPIIIDQHYCSIRGACAEQETGVQISRVLYQNIYGTSSREVAINLNCSRSVPCIGITMRSVRLTTSDSGTQIKLVLGTGPYAISEVVAVTTTTTTTFVAGVHCSMQST